jgi:DNA-binding NarL/FixJ family response regulator
MSEQIRLVFADDHPFFRDGLRAALGSADGLRLVGEAADGARMLELLQSLQPDVAIIDIGLPVMNGVTVVRQIRKRRLPVEVVFLTVHDDEGMFEEALELGVKGYLLKDCTATEMIRCVRAVASGQHYTMPPMTSYLVGKMQRVERFAGTVPGLNLLTPHERTILRGIAQEKTSKDIAEELGIAPKTVDAHRANICAKLEIHGQHVLTRFAIRHRADL